MKNFPLSILLLTLSACASTLPTKQATSPNSASATKARPLPYLEPSQSDRCQNPEKPCTFSYDFEPSGAAIDVFAEPDERPRLLVLNEDGVLFHWSLAENNPWNQDNVSFARSLTPVLRKGESATSGVCNGVPVYLAAANFMPGWTGTHPKRERVVAVVGSLNAEPRILHELSRAIRDVARREGVAWAKVEGLALSADCKTLHVGFRSVHNAELTEEIFTTLVHSFRVDLGLGETAGVKDSELRSEAEANAPKALKSEVDGQTALPSERVEHLGSRTLKLEPTCSGEKEGISGLDILPDGSLLALSSYELEIQGRTVPSDVPQGELGGSLWHIPAELLPGAEVSGDEGEGATTKSKEDSSSKSVNSSDSKSKPIRRLACFPGHKPEAVVALEDGKSVRVLMEDDDYGGRPIHSFAVALELPEDLRSDKAEVATEKDAEEGSVDVSGEAESKPEAPSPSIH